MFSIILKPRPSPPSKLDLGTFTLSNIISEVSVPRIPILSSCAPTEKPSHLDSTIKVLIPLVPLLLSVIAEIIAKSQIGALVIKHFLPLNS